MHEKVIETKETLCELIFRIAAERFFMFDDLLATSLSSLFY